MTSLPIHELLDARSKASAYEAYALVREEAPIVREEAEDGSSIWYVTRHAEVEAVLRDDGRFVRDARLALSPRQIAALPSDPVLSLVTDNMLNKDGEDHRRLRRLIAAAFKPQIVQALQPRIQAIADALLARVRPLGRMDLVEDYALPLPIIVIAELLGFPPEDRARLRVWSSTFVDPVRDEAGLARFCEQMEEFTAYVRALLASRPPGGAQDLIGGLSCPEDGSAPLRESELLSMVLLLIVAGHETTLNLLANGTLALLREPERIEEIRRTPELMEAAVEELLRYDAPLDRALTRWAVEDTVVAGCRIRRGDRVVALIGAANHDPARFVCPEALDFQRPQNPHCAFGRGSHRCLGAPLARLEGRIGLATLFATLPGLKLGVEQGALRWRPLPHMRSLVELPLVWPVEGGRDHSRRA